MLIAEFNPVYPPSIQNQLCDAAANSDIFQILDLITLTQLWNYNKLSNLFKQ
jgi:hypothetical protein